MGYFMNKLTNFHALQIKFHGPCNTRGARVSIHSPRFKRRVYLTYDYETNTLGTAYKWLTTNGFNIVGKAEFGDSYLLFSDTFEPLRDHK